jgi:hypothetical protein
VPNLWIRRLAIDLAASKPSPSRIPLSDRSAVSRRDYFTAYVIDDDADHRAVLFHTTTHGARALIFKRNANAPGLECTVLNAGIASQRLEIVQYYAELEIRYSSAWEFVLHQVVGYARLALLRDRLSQAWFNQRKFVRRDRSDVLRSFVEATLKKADYKTSHLGLMTDLYGPRWAQHPGYEPVANYYELLLDALVEHGDLKVQGHQYGLAAKGLNTLADYEEDERRHRDNRVRQTVLGVLTAALVIVGIGQLAFQTWDRIFPDSTARVPALGGAP